jgi:aspartyl/asparaginyl-tRNA synthetase
MSIEHSYREARDLMDDMLKFIFRKILQDHQEELERVKAQFPHDDIVFPDQTLVLTFRDGVKLLRESGWQEEDQELSELDDLSRAAEVRLGQLVKEKYHTDYYILGTSYPSSSDSRLSKGPHRQIPSRSSAILHHARRNECQIY